MTSEPSPNPHETLEGWTPNLDDPSTLIDALEKAFDYRGDVTITRRDGSSVEGYIFDRRRGTGAHDSYVRLLPRDGDERIRIAYTDIATVRFTGKDAAHGKSWENWVRRYIEKKQAGQNADLHADPLE